MIIIITIIKINNKTQRKQKYKDKPNINLKKMIKKKKHQKIQFKQTLIESEDSQTIFFIKKNLYENRQQNKKKYLLEGNLNNNLMMKMMIKIQIKRKRKMITIIIIKIFKKTLNIISRSRTII